MGRSDEPSCSQPPDVALALSASGQQLVLAAAGGPAAALPRAVEGAQAGGAELEGAVGSAADPFAFHRVTPGRVLAARAGLQALVAEERFGDLKRGKRRRSLPHRPRSRCNFTGRLNSLPQIYPVCRRCCRRRRGRRLNVAQALKCFCLTGGCRSRSYETGPEPS